MQKALVLGVTGQDGSYLAEVLLEKGYEVHGMVRRSATGNTRNIQHLIDDPAVFNQRFFLCRGDLADPTSLYRIISQIKPQGFRPYMRTQFSVIAVGNGTMTLQELNRLDLALVHVLFPLGHHTFIGSVILDII